MSHSKIKKQNSIISSSSQDTPRQVYLRGTSCIEYTHRHTDARRSEYKVKYTSMYIRIMHLSWELYDRREHAAAPATWSYLLYCTLGRWFGKTCAVTYTITRSVPYIFCGSRVADRRKSKIFPISINLLVRKRCSIPKKLYKPNTIHDINSAKTQLSELMLYAIISLFTRVMPS